MGEIVNFRRSNFIVFPRTQVKTAKPNSGETDKKPSEKESDNYKERFLWLARKYQRLTDALFDACASGDTQACLREFAAQLLDQDSRDWENENNRD